MPDKAQDIYALACLAYEMLTGEPPYSPEAAVQRRPYLMPGKPECLTEAAWEVLKSGLAYSKEQRPKSAGELVRCLQETGVQTQEVKIRGEVTPRQPKKREPKKKISPGPFIHGWSEKQVQALQRETAQALGLPVVFRDKLQDGSEGPEMVVIPAGRFLMGSPEDEPERSGNERQHELTIQRPYAIGRCAVTFEEFDYVLPKKGFFKQIFGGGTDRAQDEGWGRGRRPVINVSWEDAVTYAERLSAQTGQEYRLPTEAEWEYAARAGTATPFHFGRTINTDQANYDGNYTYADRPKGEYRQKTVEVGHFPPNAWGLQEVHGNVWEWTCSEYDESYGGAETRCVSKDRVGQRVLRGGSWSNVPRNVRSANRSRHSPVLRNDGVGFRLARSL